MIKNIDSVLEEIELDFSKNRFSMDINKYLSMTYDPLNYDLIYNKGVTIPFINKNDKNNIKIIILKTLASKLISHITYDIDKKIKVDIKAKSLEEITEFINIYVYLFDNLDRSFFHYENIEPIIKDLNEHIKEYNDSYCIPQLFQSSLNFYIFFSYLDRQKVGFYIITK